MIIVLKQEELNNRDQIIRQKQQEGYTLLNVSETFDSMVTGPTGTVSSPKLILEFKKL